MSESRPSGSAEPGGRERSSTSAQSRSSKMRMSQRSQANYRSSREEAIQNGVPEDYVDALLDDEYMCKLLHATDHLNKKRVKKKNNYRRMNQVILICLLLQALFGIGIAILKHPAVAPATIFKGLANLDNTDMVIMMDTSGHIRPRAAEQANITSEMTLMMEAAMKDVHENTKKSIGAEVRQAQDDEADKTPIMSWLMSWNFEYVKDEDVVIDGGYLRINTGRFNAEATQSLAEGFTIKQQTQQKELDEMQKNPDAIYEKTSHLYTAMDHCYNVAANKNQPNIPVDSRSKLKFCVLIGDSDAACRPRPDKGVVDTCEAFNADPTKSAESPCPLNRPLQEVGSPLEFTHEMEDCATLAEFKLDDNLEKDQMSKFQQENMKLVMIFSVKNDEEVQLRLSNKPFRDFVTRTTECKVKEEDITYLNEQGFRLSRKEYSLDNSTCTRFIMAQDKEEMMEKIEKLAAMLGSDTNVVPIPNNQPDRRYMWFLLLPLNLLFFIFWSKVVRWYTLAKTKAHKVMGHKKKMIKVTKTLVEKPRRDSVAERFFAQLTEVEMGAMQNLRPPIEYGATMNLRARLKGAYMHADPHGQTVDGNGKAHDPLSGWTFEPVDPSDIEAGSVQPGGRVRIRNFKGQLMEVTPDGVRFRDGNDPGGESTEFVMESADANADEDTQCHLGDTIRLRACGTGKHLRIHRDGHTDGNGEPKDAETQFVIDRGGKPISNGNIVTLKSPITDAFMVGTPEGQLSAAPGGDDWRYWQIQKKATKARKTLTGAELEAGARTFGGAETGGGRARGATLKGDRDAEGYSEEDIDLKGALQVGDIITLKGFNQRMLEVDSKGRGHCGTDLQKLSGIGTIAEGDEDKDDAPPPPAEGPMTQEFVIERVGMTSKGNDNTIRKGVQVCLRPVSAAGDDVSNYLKIDENDGSVKADGKVSDGAITLVMDLAGVHDMVKPLHGALHQGDVDLLVSPLWNKAEIKKLDAMSSSWTHDEELNKFKGQVVDCTGGTYTVPKAQGGGSGWVAVVNDGVDLHKAAKQAKAQGANGLIVRCAQALSLEKLAHSVDDNAEKPELPAVFVNHEVGEALEERGIVLNGCEFRKKYMTEVMRSIGKVGAKNNAETVGEVFNRVGDAMLERKKEKDAEPEVEDMSQYEDEYGEDGGEQDNYKWKVQSNTHYLWAKSGGGGATMMKVNYGAKAPPSAIKKHKVDKKTGAVVTDASKDHHNKESTKVTFGRKNSQKIGMAVVPAESLKGAGLGMALESVVQDEDMDPTQFQQNDQLSEESDFKIEYNFEEIEVEHGAKMEDVQEDEEVMDDELSGAVVGKIGVPLRHFWMVAMGLILSTVVLVLALRWLLAKPPEEPKEEETPSWLSQDNVAAFNAVASAASSLRSTVSRLRL